MNRLRQRADFLAVADGARVNSAAFVVQARRRDDNGPIRIGFTVTRKQGTATERNRVRRRLRELVKQLDVISMRPHSDYVLVGRRAALNRDFATMLEDLRSALHRLDRQPERVREAKSTIDNGPHDEGGPRGKEKAPVPVRSEARRSQPELNDETKR
jgi:ribonuclease P protein component